MMKRYPLLLMLACCLCFCSCGEQPTEPAMNHEGSPTIQLWSARTTYHEGDSTVIKTVAGARFWAFAPASITGVATPTISAGKVRYDGLELPELTDPNTGNIYYWFENPPESVPIRFGRGLQQWWIAGSDSIPSFAPSAPLLPNETRIVWPRHGDTIPVSKPLDVRWEASSDPAIMTSIVLSGSGVTRIDADTADTGNYRVTGVAGKGWARLSVQRSREHWSDIARPHGGERRLCAIYTTSTEFIDVYLED